MAEKYQNKYRIPSARLRNWDYSSDAVYFITICTTNHHYFFGKIENGKMEFSEIGLLVQQEWLKSFEIRAELFCDCYVIMPNHIHAILRIENGIHVLDDVHPVSNIKSVSHLESETDGRPSLRPTNFGVAYRPPKSISSFVAGFKSVVTANAHKINGRFGWQEWFYDHIIRDDPGY